MTASRQLISEGCQELPLYTVANKKREIKTGKNRLMKVNHVADSLLKWERQTKTDRQMERERERGPNHLVSHPTG